MVMLKKSKGKKIPQRGLGVAQLEKLRIEEQQKNHNNASSSSASNPSPSSSFVLPVNSPMMRSAQTIDFFKPGPICSPNPEDIKYFSGLWSERMSSFHEAETTMPGKFGVQTQYLPPIPLVNKSKLDFNLRIEPPSNQNYSTSNCTMHSSSWPNEERIAGKNLSWPFQFDATFLKPDDSMNSMYGKFPSKFNYENSTRSSKENFPAEIHVNKRPRENGGFLNLGSSATQSSSGLKLPIPFLPSRGLEHHEFPLLHSQQCGNSSEKNFCCFLPIAGTSSERNANTQNDEAVDDVDVRLKL